LNIASAVMVPDGDMDAPIPMMYDVVNGGIGIQTSSLRFKSDVSTLDFNAESFLSLDAREFTWTESGRRDIGFIAEEVAAFDPRLGVSDGQGGYISMHYDKMTVYLFQVVKALNARVAELEAKLNA